MRASAKHGLPTAGVAGCLVFAIMVNGCQLEREASILEQQSAAGRLSATRSELKHLEQEHQREQAHVEELERRVLALRSREDVLAAEALDLDAKVKAAEERLRALKDKAAAVEAETDAMEAAAPGEAGEGMDLSLEERLKLLIDEAARLAAELEKARAAPRDPQESGTGAPPPAPPVPPESKTGG